MTHDEGEDDSSSQPGEPGLPGDAEGPEVPEHPPGHPSWLRILSETNSAQQAPLEEGVDRVRATDPTHWSGSARDGFVARRDELAEKWQAVLGIHGGVSKQVDGYNRFLHQLPHLWEEYRNDPDELRRLNALHDEAAERLARALEGEAAKLDGLPGEPASREDLRPAAPEPEPATKPDLALAPRSDAEPDLGVDADADQASDSDPDPQSVSDSTTTNSGEVPRLEQRHDPIAAAQVRIIEHSRVNELMQTGYRVERFLWKRTNS